MLKILYCLFAIAWSFVEAAGDKGSCRVIPVKYVGDKAYIMLSKESAAAYREDLDSWDGFGGKVNPGSTFNQTFVEELDEESGGYFKEDASFFEKKEVKSQTINSTFKDGENKFLIVKVSDNVDIKTAADTMCSSCNKHNHDHKWCEKTGVAWFSLNDIINAYDSLTNKGDPLEVKPEKDSYNIKLEGDSCGGANKQISSNALKIRNIIKGIIKYKKNEFLEKINLAKSSGLVLIPKVNAQPVTAPIVNTVSTAKSVTGLDLDKIKQQIIHDCKNAKTDEQKKEAEKNCVEFKKLLASLPKNSSVGIIANSNVNYNAGFGVEEIKLKKGEQILDLAPVKEAFNYASQKKESSLFFFDFDKTLINGRNMVKSIEDLNSKEIPWVILTARNSESYKTEDYVRTYVTFVKDFSKLQTGANCDVDLNELKEAIGSCSNKESIQCIEETFAKAKEVCDLQNDPLFYGDSFFKLNIKNAVNSNYDNSCKNKFVVLGNMIFMHHQDKTCGISYTLNELKKQNKLPKYVIFVDDLKENIDSVSNAAKNGILKEYVDQYQIKFILVHYLY